MDKKYYSSDYIHYDGIYREEHHKMYDYIFIEEIQTRSKDFQWEISQHFHSDLYQLFVINEGFVRVNTEDVYVELTAPCFVFIPPNSKHGFSFDESVKGEIISFSSFYIQDLVKVPGYQELLELKTVVWNEHLTEQNNIELNSILKNIEYEIFSNKTYRTEAIKLLIVSLFIQISRLNFQIQNTPSDAYRGMVYLKEFLSIIQNTDNPFEPIRYYAEKIGISQGHLNRICRTIKNRSALSIIQGVIIQKAKIYLRHTTYSVNEISYQLGIEDSSYFIRMFKKHTGLTPKQFRSEKF